jgi:hypothetical protein
VEACLRGSAAIGSRPNRPTGFGAHAAIAFRSSCSGSGFPVSEEHAAGGFDSLTVDPEIVVRQQGSDNSADIVGQPGKTVLGALLRLLFAMETGLR